ncbi:hypothetical protein O5274_27215, partial [Escherichia coli]|nr:hypothetical protein [Escherichia coli]
SHFSQNRFWVSPKLRGCIHSIMVVGVCVMMLLYGGYLTWIVLCLGMVCVSPGMFDTKVMVAPNSQY